MNPDDAVEDALGLLCPLPVLRARRRLQELAPGQVLLLLADDEAVREDIPAWCAGAGHEVLGIEEESRAGRRSILRVWLRRGR